MAIIIPASITGSAQTGFTTPGYTTAVDQAPDVNAKQVAVTAITGTQPGVDVSSMARPFTLTFTKPKQFQALGKPNPVTGLISNVLRNVFKFLTRKGVTVLAGQPSQVAMIRTEIEVPAGADTADIANLRAMISAHIGSLSSFSAGLGDTIATGVV